jgi:magnesium chelatase subunit H
VNITVLYVGSSLLAPLKKAEEEINRVHSIKLRVAAYNLGATLTSSEWMAVERDIEDADVVFVFHVTDGGNAEQLIKLLNEHESSHKAVVVINCMPDLMRRTRMGKLRFGGESRTERTGLKPDEGRARRLARSVSSWMGETVRGRRKTNAHGQYLRLIERMPSLLKFIPGAGKLRDVKHYLLLFCYFLQPTPANIRTMLLYSLKHYAKPGPLATLSLPPPETMPASGIYHPDAPSIFATFDSYLRWYKRRGGKRPSLEPENAIGLLLMRTQVVSGTRKHYDALVRSIEDEGLAVVPAISTFMDNREACERFFIDKNAPAKTESVFEQHHGRPVSRVSQVVSLTGFSFVGGPAMNDSEAAVGFLSSLNRPFRSMVSLDVQSIESWQASWTGLNPVQSGMQVAIPELDGATEPFVYGGISQASAEPVELEDRCRRIARRLKRWNRLQTAKPGEIKVALVIFCFPPNKGNIGTAADLDVFQSICDMLTRLSQEGYRVELPHSADDLRARIIGGNSEQFGSVANVAYRMSVDEYLRSCPYAGDIEAEWGRAPGTINSLGRDLLIHGVELGNVFVAVQPTFGYEGDPMRLLMSRGGAPHHGFAALYTYLDKIFRADAVVHVGTHGALEFMPGKQVGLSDDCWPDRLIGEFPHVYVYSVNNPSEGSIARRRSYAELISYLTPPVEDAGVYRDLAALKDAITTYRHSIDDSMREQLFAAIEEKASALHFQI